MCRIELTQFLCHHEARTTGRLALLQMRDRLVLTQNLRVFNPQITEFVSHEFLRLLCEKTGHVLLGCGEHQLALFAGGIGIDHEAETIKMADRLVFHRDLAIVFQFNAQKPSILSHSLHQYRRPPIHETFGKLLV